MSQQDHFGSGFLWGTLFGGILGGVIGALVTTRIQSSGDATADLLAGQDSGESELPPSEMDMELTRRGLEDKIAQLNLAIDDVRQRLGANGSE